LTLKSTISGKEQGMGRRKTRSQLDAIDEINMTPLIDLTFLLLIIFMITAPLLEYGVDVSPPDVNAATLPDKNTATVNLDRRGQIIYNRVSVSSDELLLDLTRLYETNPKTVILVRADGSREYREVMELMKLVTKSGFTNVSLVTQAEGND
jgi:biopolymer transport protein ExbD